MTVADQSALPHRPFKHALLSGVQRHHVDLQGVTDLPSTDSDCVAWPLSNYQSNKTGVPPRGKNVMRWTEVRVRDSRVRRPDTHVRMYSITTSAACACTLLLMVQRVDKEAWVARKILVRTTLLLESTRHPLCDGEPGSGGDSCTQ